MELAIEEIDLDLGVDHEDGGETEVDWILKDIDECCRRRMPSLCFFGIGRSVRERMRAVASTIRHAYR